MSTPKKNFELSKLLPAKLKNPTSLSLLSNLFDRFLSKDTSQPILGWVGDNLPNSLFIEQQVFEKKINSLEPVLYTKHGTEEYVTSFKDALDKLEMLGVNTDDFDKWGQAQKFNFAPPIDIDKFINFPRYRWIGNVIKHKLTHDYNPNIDPEYYVIEWPVKDTLRKVPVRAASTRYLGSLIGSKKVDGVTLKNGDRVLVKDQELFKDNGIYLVSAYDPQNPPRVVITGNVNISVPGAHKASDTVAIVDENTGLISGIELPTDVGLGYAVAPQVSFIGGTAGGATATAIIDANGSISGFAITSPGAAWTRAADFANEDNVVQGSLIPVVEGNINGGTFWQLSSRNPRIDYDSLSFEKFNQTITDWTASNFWVHENDVADMGIDINQTSQALRPIIQYDYDLELNSLIDVSGKPLVESEADTAGATRFEQKKSRFNQVPLFNLYTLDDTPTTNNGAPTGLVSAIFYYAEDKSYPVDAVLRRRAASPSTLAKDYIFEQGLIGDSGRMYFFKKNGVPTTIWAPGEVESPKWLRDAGDGVNFVEMPAGPRGDRQSILNVRLATPARTGQTPVTVALAGLYEFDGHQLNNGDLILVSDQPNKADNGVYVASQNTWSRSIVFSHATSGKVVHVLEGSKANTDWALVTVDPIVYGTSEVSFAQIDNTVAGAWKIPSQVMHNIQHENRSQTRFADLRTHMSSILQEQPGFVGSSFGKNNSRTLESIDMGLGGLIKDYNSGFNLLMSFLNQKDVSPLSVIDFGQHAYESALNGATEFLTLNLIDLITSGDVQPLVGIDRNDDGVKHLLDTYETTLAARSDLTKIYGDSTSAMTNWPATLPYLGYAATPPQYKFDLELGINVIVHHDGHESPSFYVDETTVLRLCQKEILRSDGNRVAGALTVNPPSNPYRNQLWFNTAERQLYMFSVLSDTDVFGDDIAFEAGEKAVSTYKNSNPAADDATLNLIRANASRSALNVVRANLKNGDLWYKRSTSILHSWDSIQKIWQPLLVTPDRPSFVSPSTPASLIKQNFKKLDLTSLYNSFILAIEQKLYDGIPPMKETRIDPTLFANAPEREIELAAFAAKHNLDMYVTDFNPSDAYTPSDPFTWNYSQAVYSGVPGAFLGIQPGYARWHVIYNEFFGTARPNLEPWILTRQTEDDFRTMWPDDSFGSEEMWSYVRSVWQKPLGVRTSTNELLPPYVSPRDPDAPDALLTTIPPGVSERYKLGDLGPVELAWSKSIDYRYGMVRVTFRKSPAGFLRYGWGNNTVTVNDYQIDKALGKKISQSELILHGEKITHKSNNSVDTLFDVNPSATAGHVTTWTLKCVSNLPSTTAFSCANSNGEKMQMALTGQNYTASSSTSSISFKLSNVGLDFEKGDTITITWDPVTANMSVTFAPAVYKIYGGFGQLYSHLMRYNTIDTSTALNVSLLRNWEIKLGYRVGGMINTDTLKMKTDAFTMHDSDFRYVVATNPYFKDTWLESLRIHVLQAGASVLKNGVSVPVSDGSDWKFRVEIYNFNRPQLSYYTFNTNGDFTTFSSLDKSKTNLSWKKFVDIDELNTVSTPFIIVGIQNVINFIFGYAKKLEEDGWVFDNDLNPQIDNETGRSNGMQLEVEKFVNAIYSGITAGQGVIINPFIDKVWINHPVGLSAEMKGGKFIDLRTAPCVLDMLGNVIPKNDYRVIRTDDITEISSNVPMTSVHAMIDAYEHVIVFNQYSSDAITKNLIYDPFLGMRTKRIYLDGKKQADFNGKPHLDGHFVKDSEVSENIETSVAKILNYYATDEISGSTATSVAAQSLLGYNKRDYFTNIDVPDNSQFNFWKGLIHNKGSNLSIDAYLNSAKFKSAEIDEYWAYKLATYGDTRQKSYPEIKLNSDDTKNRFTVLRFREVGESLDTLKDGTIVVSPHDKSRWFTLDDVGTVLYFEAQVLNTVTGIGIADQVIDLPVVADDISGATMINSTTAKLDSTGPYQITCYGPAAPKFSPAKLIDYQDQASMGDIPIWDPARGLHNPRAMEILDVVGNNNPARFNVSTQTVDNPSYDPLRPWGSDEVGTVWWDTTNRAYLKYSDTAVFPLRDDRLNRWGSLADWASIDVYEWVSSTVPPSEWGALVKKQSGDSNIPSDKKASGTPAQPLVFSRNRQWKQRTIAWRYSPNPPEGHNFVNGSGQQKMLLTANTVGSQTAILNVDRFSTFGITSGMNMSAFDVVADKPYGVGKFNGSVYYVCGKEEPALWQDNALDPIDSDKFTVINVTSSKVTKMGKYIGPLTMSYFTDNGDMYIQASTVLTGNSQYIRIPSDVAANQTLVFDFSDLGITLTGTAKANVSVNDIAINFGSPTHDIYIREAMAFNVEMAFPDESVNLENFGMSRDADDGLSFSWVVWDDPTPAQLLSDLPTPNNCWEPVYGDWQPADFSSSLLERINAYASAPLITSDGVKQEKFSFSWTDWSRLSNFTVNRKCRAITSVPFSLSFPPTAPLNVDGNVDSGRVKVYIDGQLVKTDQYTVSGRVVIMLNHPAVGQLMTITLGHYVPSATELAFDPDTKDDVKIVRQYKVDYEYSTEIIRDSYGNISATTYYFWVKDKTFAVPGKSMSIKAATSLLTVNTDPYLVLQDYKKESMSYKEVLNDYPPGYDLQPYDIVGQDTDGFDLIIDKLLPRRYVTVAINGLSRQVTKDNTYKLRFTKDFTLRNDPNGVDLKNVHTEWTLIRPSQQQRIPKKLWDLLTDAVCGVDASGNLIPSLDRVDYDAINGTTSRFGFEPDQVLVDKSLALETIKYTILNTSLRREIPGNNSAVPDVITVLDFNSADAWFTDANSTRYTLTKIWNEAKPTQINEIFFAVLNDALANNYEFTDIFKTSMLSAYSIRVLQNVLN